MLKLSVKNALPCLLYLLLAAGLLAGCTAKMVAQESPTPTPEVFIPRTVVAPDGPMVSGRVLWASTPVAGARVELRTGAWADPNNSEVIAVTVADSDGQYQLEAPPAGGPFGLVALWPDGGINVAPVTPVQVEASTDLTGVDVYLAKELGLLEPVSGAEVEATPTLRWAGLPGVAAYTLQIVDAGTTELVFDLAITEISPTMHLVAPPLTPDRTYRWVVNGWERDDGDSSASNLLAGLASEFKVAPQAAVPASQPPTLVSLDETWYQYTNPQLGFSIKFPQSIVSPYGSCTWNEENGDHSYRPEPFYVPAKTFEDGDVTYIAGEYYYQLNGETQETSADGATRTFFSACQVVTNSLGLLRDPDSYYQTKWAIVARDVQDDAELDAFIKSRYGSGCSLGEQVASSQEGVYDVRIQGDGKDLSETMCPLNYVTVVKYYPKGGKVIAWDLGQGPTFAADVAYAAIYDQEMVDSFRFLTE